MDSESHHSERFMVIPHQSRATSLDIYIASGLEDLKCVWKVRVIWFIAYLGSVFNLGYLNISVLFIY